MVSLGLAFNPEEDLGYLPFLAVMAFVTLIFFLVKISQFNLKKQYKTILFFCFTGRNAVAWVGRHNIKWAVYSGLYGCGLCRMVFNQSRLRLFTPAASGITVERSLYSLEVRGQRRGLYERDGTV